MSARYPATPREAEHTFKLGRAAFLGLTAATVGALAVGKAGLPSVSLVPTGGAENGFTLYTVVDGFPGFDPSTYELSIGGMVKQPLTMPLHEVLRHPAVTTTQLYTCVTGWTVPHVHWTGIRLADLLARVQPQAEAHALTFYSFDGVYTESLTMEQARKSDVLLAHHLNGKPLPRGQGAPLRLIVPGMYGYKFIKWLNRIELVPKPIDGYWEQRGYDRDAYVGRSNSFFGLG
jgi:DMSO/TMAO reductase YedYZ molybdopterin-dependent catalytic subunit